MLGTSVFSNRSTKFFILILLVIFGLFYFPALFKWWYEDDTFQYFYVSTIADPINIFTDAETMRKFSRAFVPMQILSYWVDFKLFGFNFLAAYIHSLLSLLFTSVVLFKVAKKLTQDSFVSMSMVITWLLLPSTLVVTQFIATRHYLEGLFFALLAIYFLIVYLEKSEEKSFRFVLLITFFAFLSIFCKEIYATSIMFLLFILGIIYKKIPLIISSIILALSYFAYRNWVFGTDINYTMPFLGAKQYLYFLYFQIYTFSANYWGYAILIGILFLNFLMIRRFKQTAVKEFGLFIGLTSACLLALYPVAYAIFLTYKTPGTWYRATFITNTILALWGVYSLSKITSKKVFAIILCISLLPVFWGTVKTRKLWDEKMARAEMEGKFYLNNPDKLLYSEEDASWFIDGVQKMYPANKQHFINKQFLVGDNSKTMILNYPTIWRYDSGSFVADEKLYNELKEQNGIK